jgi:hypothetical protein
VDQIATALADAVDAAIPGWVQRCVERVLIEQSMTITDDVRAAAEEAGRRAAEEIGVQLRSLLSADIDEQRSTPLTVLRAAVVYPTGVLRAAGARPMDRDDFDRDAFPEDHFGLNPATFADIDPALTEPGLAWGAAKAFEHKRRHSS